MYKSGNPFNRNVFKRYNPKHLHQFRGVTSSNVGHVHRFIGSTSLSVSGRSHVHTYYIYTTLDSGHKHYLRQSTGPAIYLPNGRHYHLFNGYTSVNGFQPHRHHYYGSTSIM